MGTNKFLLAGGLFLAVAGAAVGGAKSVVKAAAAEEAQNSNPAFIQTVGAPGEDINDYIDYINKSAALREEYAGRMKELDLEQSAEVTAAAEKVLPGEFEILMTDLSFLNSEYSALTRTGKAVRADIYSEAADISARIEAMIIGNSAAVRAAADKINIKYAAGKEALSIELKYALNELRAQYKI